MAKFDAFVSYSGLDQNLVTPIVQFLSVGGRRVFWDRVTLTPGERWAPALMEALRVSDTVMVLWCCHAASSEWVAREVATATAAAKPLIPVLLCPYPLEQPLSDYQGIDCRTSLQHRCVSHGSDSIHGALIAANVSLLVTAVGLRTLDPAAVRSTWVAEVSRSTPIDSGPVTRWLRAIMRRAQSLSQRTLVLCSTLSILLLIPAVLLVAVSVERVFGPDVWPVPIAVGSAAIIGVLAALDALPILYRRQRLLRASYASQLLGLTLEAIIRRSHSGDLGAVLQRRTPGG